MYNPNSDVNWRAILSLTPAARTPLQASGRRRELEVGLLLCWSDL